MSVRCWPLMFLSCLFATSPAAQDDPAKKGPAAELKTVTLDGALTSLQPAGTHGVKLQKGFNYGMDLRSPGFHTMARIEDDKGRVVFSFAGFTVFQPPGDGMYRLVVSSPAGNSGEYTISLRQLPLTKVAPLLAIPKAGLSVDDALTNADGMDKVRKRPCKIYAVKMTAGKKYTIDMLSKHFDAFLRLEDAAGKQLAQDDDSGEGNNARVKFQPKADGVFRIIATSFAGGAGLFTLKVKEE